ncbi:MAG: formyltransferase [Candidatus Scalindua sp.]|nr:formyltransferase [Candidatus Scalindua sp.]
MRIIVMGYHAIGCRCLKYLIEEKEHIVAIFTHKDNPGENLFFDSMTELARLHGIPCYMPEHINTHEWISLIEGLSPDVIFSFYYRNLVSRQILDIPRLGAINLHGSLLPEYRGRCPVNWVLVNGEKETGVTLHYMVEKADAGDIIAQRKIPVLFDDTAYSLYKKTEKEAVTILDETLPLIKKGKNNRIPQDLSRGTYFGGRKPDDGRIHWERKNSEIYNLVRAVTHPWPGAFCFFREKKVFIWQCLPLSVNGHHKPGNLISFDKEGIIAAAGKGTLLLKRCQIEGEEEKSGYEFAQTYVLREGEMFT